MRALVTGCAGFIGGHLSESLLERGWHVLGVDCFLPSYPVEPRRATASQLISHPAFQFQEVDLADADLDRLLEGVTVVFHLAAKAGVRSSWDSLDSYLRPNLLATQHLLAAAARCGVKVVFASSSSVYGRASSYPVTEASELRPVSPYGVTKAAGEQLVAAYRSEFGLDAVILRYFTVYGPRQRSDMAFHIWIKAALEGKPIRIFGDGTAVRDFTYVADVVDATVAAAGSTGATMNVAGGSPVTLVEVVSLLQQIIGVELSVSFSPRVEGDPARTGGDTSLLRELTGWDARVGLEEGLRAQVSWMKREIAAVEDS